MSKDKIGRNDPCPCGSGKKYKKCCAVSMKSPSTVSLVDFQWKKLRQIEGSVFEKHLLPYIHEHLPEKVMYEAFHDFMPEGLPDDCDCSPELIDPFFVPWCIFNWLPDDGYGVKTLKNKKTIAENYLASHGHLLNTESRKFLEAMNQTYYSYYVVHRVEKHKALHVKDLFLGKEHLLKERSGTEQASRGDILFTRILEMDGQSIFIGMAPFLIPAKYHSVLLETRESFIEYLEVKRLTPKRMRALSSCDLIQDFFDLVKEMFTYRAPILTNTDGDLINPSKAFYKIKIPPEEALKKLLPMSLSETPDEAITNSQKDKSGKVISLSFDWSKKRNNAHKNWENTLLGNIKIKGSELTLETNSRERADQGRQILEKLLGSQIQYKQTVLETVKATDNQGFMPSGDGKSQEELMQIPEIKEHIKKMAEEHWENWFNDPIPMLDDQTPVEASKTKKGKEKLNALLLTYERHDQEKGDHPFKADIPYLRKKLKV